MRLPPLNALRAFDAVARLGSVRAAADELAVTPAAVSQQLRVLEAHLGLALTQREGRGIALTDSGRSWHGEIARHLRAIAQAAERVRPGRRVVQVTVVPSFGSRWNPPSASQQGPISASRSSSTAAVSVCLRMSIVTTMVTSIDGSSRSTRDPRIRRRLTRRDEGFSSNGQGYDTLRSLGKEDKTCSGFFY